MRIVAIALAGLLGAVICAGEPPAASDLPKGVVSVPLKIVGDRAFIQVTLNDKTSCDCLLDTGSELTLLNKAKVTLKDLRMGGSDPLHGDFVGALNAQRAILDSFSVGSSVSKNLPISVIEHGPGQKLENVAMLLGMDFLARQRVTLDFANERFLLWPARSELPRAPATIERQRMLAQPGPYTDDRRPRVLAVINQKVKLTLLADTGAAALTMVAIKKLEECGLKPEGPLSGLMTINDGGNKRQLSIHTVSVARLDFERMSFADVSGRVVDASTVVGPVARADIVGAYNIVGLPFLKTLSAVHFDAPDRAVYFDRLKPNVAPK